MQDKINFISNIDSYIIPYSFTYFDHFTSFIPKEIKDRAERGKYMRNWTTLPKGQIIVDKEMSFIERDEKIRRAIKDNKPLSDISVMHQLYDYSKPFMIRVIIPKLEYVINDALAVRED